ncbi:MAG: oxidoreductase [Acidobacteria bacterium RIFCSPLOWO2_12_FULL_54_10]|nr:MAG: oxidoreductase [Acidobacteria bacterium RIFCSPLOWO2_12_FULL_54_10]
MNSGRVKVAVVGVGRFGSHHARVYHELPNADLIGVYDSDPQRAIAAASLYGCKHFERLEDLFGQVDAASVAVPTESHASIGVQLLNAGIDVLVEKPIARTLEEADQLIDAAERGNRILQVGHLEQYNPGVRAAREIVHSPLFFEAHRMSIFTPRSLDVDVVLDLMIHDLDIVLSLVDSEPAEVRAVGLPVLSPKVDIANVRLEFQNGCIANFTASRVSTETIRKLRWFQPKEYISVDYTRQDATVTSVEFAGSQPVLSHRRLESQHGEPLMRQLMAFLNNVRERQTPEISGKEGKRALRLAHQIREQIMLHSARLIRNNATESFAPVLGVKK